MSIAGDDKKMLKEINLGLGTRDRRKIPDGEGYDLTAYQGTTAQFKVQVTITNNGMKPLDFSIYFFPFYTLNVEGQGVLDFPEKGTSSKFVSINPGKEQSYTMKFSKDIEAIGRPKDGKYIICYGRFGIAQETVDAGRENYTILPVFATNFGPFYVKEQDPKEGLGIK